jgi:hypothetical protein
MQNSETIKPAYFGMSGEPLLVVREYDSAIQLTGENHSLRRRMLGSLVYGTLMNGSRSSVTKRRYARTRFSDKPWGVPRPKSSLPEAAQGHWSRG